jgi:hypothetical protein
VRWRETIREARALSHRVDGIGSWSRVAVQLYDELVRLDGLLNQPETHDFSKGVVLEAAHQRDRWGDQDRNAKNAWDWFWLVGYLAQKAASAVVAGDTEKAKHHTISTAAALANWHAQLAGVYADFEPGWRP